MWLVDYEAGDRARGLAGLLGGLAADYFLVPVLQGAFPEGVLHLHCYAIGRILSGALRMAAYPRTH